MITKNRKAYYEFQIQEEFSAGIVLLGNEVKSIRNGDVTIGDSFAYMKNGEIWIKNVKVAPYKQAHKLDKHDDNREKKLLLNKKELRKIESKLEKHLTIVPVSIFVNDRGKIKCEIAVSKGKKNYDKKKQIKEHETLRDSMREC